MRGVAIAVVVVGVAACELVFPPAQQSDGSSPPGADASGDAATDADPDAMLGAFSVPLQIGLTPSAPAGSYDTDVALTEDMSQMVFSRRSFTVVDSADIYLAQNGGDPIV